MNADTVLPIILIYAVLNGVAFFLYWADKRKATGGKYRISESTLLISGLLGPFGALAGMKVFRHKTRKTKFKLIYLFAAVHLVLIAFIVWKLFF
ncbi:MAG: DUF1294 domain-containing protein [Candidatus Methanoplasma sp.]|jgi:uncharacterized membrane protein YsdA (DUF1294 family)|nr:DUF1294 domain-containing protein [Candidatus Methanoplasma sp.]